MRQSIKSNRPRNKNNRKNNNTSNGGGGNHNNLNRVYDSSGPDSKVRGTPQQLVDKYTALARDSQMSGDSVLSENFLQHAEHYIRVINTVNANNKARQTQAAQTTEASSPAFDADNPGDPVKSEASAETKDVESGIADRPDNGLQTFESSKQNRKPASFARADSDASAQPDNLDVSFGNTEETSPNHIENSTQSGLRKPVSDDSNIDSGEEQERPKNSRARSKTAAVRSRKKVAKVVDNALEETTLD